MAIVLRVAYAKPTPIKVFVHYKALSVIDSQHTNSIE